jgi:hypothetical protein
MARLKLSAIPIPVKSPEVVAVNNDKNAFVFGRGKPLKANLCIWNDKNVNDSGRCLHSRSTTKVATLNKSVVGKSGQKKEGSDSTHGINAALNGYVPRRWLGSLIRKFCIFSVMDDRYFKGVTHELTRIPGSRLWLGRGGRGW